MDQSKIHSAPTVAAAPARLMPTPPVIVQALLSAVRRKLTPTALSPLNTADPTRIATLPGAEVPGIWTAIADATPA